MAEYMPTFINIYHAAGTQTRYYTVYTVYTVLYGKVLLRVLPFRLPLPPSPSSPFPPLFPHFHTSAVLKYQNTLAHLS